MKTYPTSRTGIHVYILDSGINESHPDFEGRALMEANFISYEDSGDFSGHGTIFFALDSYKLNP